MIRWVRGSRLNNSLSSNPIENDDLPFEGDTPRESSASLAIGRNQTAAYREGSFVPPGGKCHQQLASNRKDIAEFKLSRNWMFSLSTDTICRLTQHKHRRLIPNHSSYRTFPFRRLLWEPKVCCAPPPHTHTEPDLLKSACVLAYPVSFLLSSSLCSHPNTNYTTALGTTFTMSYSKSRVKI